MNEKDEAEKAAKRKLKDEIKELKAAKKLKLSADKLKSPHASDSFCFNKDVFDNYNISSNIIPFIKVIALIKMVPYLCIRMKKK